VKGRGGDTEDKSDASDVNEALSRLKNKKSSFGGTATAKGKAEAEKFKTPTKVKDRMDSSDDEEEEEEVRSPASKYNKKRK
jgi:hypothetical protein